MHTVDMFPDMSTVDRVAKATLQTAIAGKFHTDDVDSLAGEAYKAIKTEVDLFDCVWIESTNLFCSTQNTYTDARGPARHPHGGDSVCQTSVAACRRSRKAHGQEQRAARARRRLSCRLGKAQGHHA